MERKKASNSRQTSAGTAHVEIIYFTDPLCCWNWALEPQVRRVNYEYAGKISWRYCMGGLLPGWNNYYDEINSVSKPIQMGPLGMHAQEVSGMPMNSNIWVRDAPSSSYPACIAVKNASLQSAEAGERYLRLLREAVMINGENISKKNVLVKIAERLFEEGNYQFSLEDFKKHLNDDIALEAFRADLQEAQIQQIQRLPTFIVKNKSQGLILTGYRPYENFIEAILQICPGIEKNNPAIDSAAYELFWTSLTDKERMAITSN